MSTLLRNVLSLLAGIAIGGGVNMALIALSASATSRGWIWPSACHVSASTTPMTRSGRKRAACPMSQTPPVFRPEAGGGAPGRSVTINLSA